MIPVEDAGEAGELKMERSRRASVVLPEDEGPERPFNIVLWVLSEADGVGCGIVREEVREPKSVSRYWTFRDSTRSWSHEKLRLNL